MQQKALLVMINQTTTVAVGMLGTSNRTTPQIRSNSNSSSNFIVQITFLRLTVILTLTYSVPII